MTQVDSNVVLTVPEPGKVVMKQHPYPHVKPGSVLALHAMNFGIILVFPLYLFLYHFAVSRIGAHGKTSQKPRSCA